LILSKSTKGLLFQPTRAWGSQVRVAQRSGEGPPLRPVIFLLSVSLAGCDTRVYLRIVGGVGWFNKK
jgi:hypothetical protein